MCLASITVTADQKISLQKDLMCLDLEQINPFQLDFKWIYLEEIFLQRSVAITRPGSGRASLGNLIT